VKDLILASVKGGYRETLKRARKGPKEERMHVSLESKSYGISGLWELQEHIKPGREIARLR